MWREVSIERNINNFPRCGESWVMKENINKTLYEKGS